MTFALMASVAGIAVLDSLNPSLFVAQFVLLLAPRPTPRILAYIAGVLVVNYFGGLLILGGVRAVIADFFASLSPDVGFGLQLGVGVLLLIAGLMIRTNGEAQPPEVRKPISLHPAHTFVLGMVVMVNELTTALPYFIAIEQIASAGVSLALGALLLIFYNTIFALPLFAFLVLALRLRDRFAATLERINRWIAVWGPRIAKWFTLLIGAGLAANGAAYFLTGAYLF